ncbi:Cyclopentanone 1,2-monooxygenase [Fonsecaea pedrosoi]|nr:Cyclopentanone 1,2-monooxygenase [Fonsecaea pedrosoi]
MGSISEDVHANGTATPSPFINNLDIDVVVVGGGFGGMYAVYKLRQLGLSVKLFEAGSDFGGTWFWNRYPGARVDSESPYYGLSIPELWRTWDWSERFPDHNEIRRYFAHVDKVLDLSKDAFFNTIITEATWDGGRWTTKTQDGAVITSKYFVAATGSTYKQYYPDFKNLRDYKGILIHSGSFPSHRVDYSGKKVAVIGNGATGVQIVQETAKEDCQLTVFIRTPNIAFPMRQRKLPVEEQESAKVFYAAYYQAAKLSRGGIPYNPATTSIWAVSPEEREAYFEELWRRGGFSFSSSNYRDLIVDKRANALVYEFWLKKVRERVTDPHKAAVVAPLTQPHFFGTKRPSLEQDYYEMIDRPNVTVVDLKTHPIVEFRETGILTTEKLHEFDIVILATGFDSVTGSLTTMGLTDKAGVPLSTKWKDGVYTHLGLTICGMPNLFMVYSPQAPTSLSNGPPIIEIQVDWIADAVAKMRAENVVSIEARPAAAQRWHDDIQRANSRTLFPYTDSWYMGANIPGKPREQLLYLDGVARYAEVCKAALETWDGFDVVVGTCEKIDGSGGAEEVPPRL